MIVMRTGEIVESIASYKIKGVFCQDLKVIDKGHSDIPVGTIYMLTNKEIERNTIA